MTRFVPWNSQPLEAYAAQNSPGKFVELEGLSTHYVEKGSGKPLILLHGFFFDHTMWQKNIDALAVQFKVYAIDLWGFGYSSRKPLDYGYPLYARQLLAFMDALNLPKASMMGQSMGGGTIMTFAVANRERVDKVVLVDPAGMPNRLPLMGRISNLPGVGELLYGLKTNFVRKMTLGNTFLYDKEALKDGYFETVTRFHKIKGTSEVMLKISRTQFFDTLQGTIRAYHHVDIPTLIVWGRKDAAIPVEVGKEMHHILEDARLEVFDRAGHCPNIDQPGRFNPLVLEFLS